MKRVALAVALSAYLALAGCASEVTQDRDPAEVMKEAEEEIGADHYQLALDKLRLVRNKFPYSKHAVTAQLRIADVYYLQESYTEAALTYETFKDLHPKHEKVPYAMYRIGMSYFNDVPSVERDLTPAFKAQEAFNEFLRRFPDAPEAVEGRKKVAETRKLLAEKEYYIAEFYRRWDQPNSARRRYQKILDQYGDTPLKTTATDRLPEVLPKP